MTSIKTITTTQSIYWFHSTQFQQGSYVSGRIPWRNINTFAIYSSVVSTTIIGSCLSFTREDSHADPVVLARPTVGLCRVQTVSGSRPR